MQRLMAQLDMQKRDVLLRIMATNLEITEKEQQLEVLERAIETARFDMERLVGFRNGLDTVMAKITELTSADIAATLRLEEELKVIATATDEAKQ